jgi:hypothetical protein
MGMHLTVIEDSIALIRPQLKMRDNAACAEAQIKKAPAKKLMPFS